jgi:pimeloyl-ACP methyl ester carboxylesterase
MKLNTITTLLLLTVSTLLGLAGCSPLERKFLFYPSHLPHNNSLTPWNRNGETIGYARKVEAPGNVWLMLHGNAGQASDRIYAVPCFSDTDSVFILEYPGYGDRDGVPSKASFNSAAEEAYLFLRKTYPGIPVCVAAESIGSGPASFLATLTDKPDKLVLIVPFDRLALLAEAHFPAILVRLILTSDWDNVGALSHYPGPVEIIGAEADTIIPVGHARALAASVPGARLSIIGGGHNDWAVGGRVNIRNP